MNNLTEEEAKQLVERVNEMYIILVQGNVATKNKGFVQSVIEEIKNNERNLKRHQEHVESELLLLRQEHLNNIAILKEEVNSYKQLINDFTRTMDSKILNKDELAVIRKMLNIVMSWKWFVGSVLVVSTAVYAIIELIKSIM